MKTRFALLIGLTIGIGYALFSSYAAISPEMALEGGRESIEKNAFCQIRSNTKILLSALEDVHYEKKYELDSPDLRTQCIDGGRINIFVENSAGKVIQVPTWTGTDFPGCQAALSEVTTDGLSNYYHFDQKIFIPGTFIASGPIVVDKNYNLLLTSATSNFLQNKGLGIEQLPECKSNITPKK